MSGEVQNPRSALTAEQKREMLRQLLAKKQAAEFPLSQHQLALWFLHCLAPGMASYNVALAAEATPPLDGAALERALEKFAERHQTLRTVFFSRDGVPMQRVPAGTAVPFRTFDMRGKDSIAVREAFDAEYRATFNLELAPFRAALFHCGDSDILLLTFHHIVFDGTSAFILSRELRVFYNEETGIERTALPPISVSFRDFVEWQSRMIASEEGAQHWQYWSGRLSPAVPPLTLPFRKPPPDSPAFTGDSVPLAIEGSVYAGIREAARACRATIASVVTAAFSAVLHCVSGQDDFAIGMPVSGRTQPEWDGMVGDFINMLPLRMQFSPELTLAAHLEAVTLEIRNALIHQDFPFLLMVERLRVPRSSRSPVFQVVINTFVARTGSEVSKMIEPGLGMQFGTSTLRSLPMAQQEGQFDLRLEVLETPDMLRLALHYSDESYDRYVAEHLVRRLRTVLETMVSAPGERIADIEFKTLNSGEEESFVI